MCQQAMLSLYKKKRCLRGNLSTCLAFGINIMCNRSTHMLRILTGSTIQNQI